MNNGISHSKVNNLKVLMIGSYGTIPRPVSEAKEKLRVQIEGNPDRFMKRDWLPLLNDVREKSAEIIGAKAEECVIVPNTTHGVNTILHNIKWTAGDRIVICKFNLLISNVQLVLSTRIKEGRYGSDDSLFNLWGSSANDEILLRHEPGDQPWYHKLDFPMLPPKYHPSNRGTPGALERSESDWGRWTTYSERQEGRG